MVKHSIVFMFALLASAKAAEQTLRTTEISRHNKKSDCWISIDGSVYDVTRYLERHKDFEYDIAKHCGSNCWAASVASKTTYAVTAKHWTRTVKKLWSRRKTTRCSTDSTRRGAKNSHRSIMHWVASPQDNTRSAVSVGQASVLSACNHCPTQLFALSARENPAPGHWALSGSSSSAASGRVSAGNIILRVISARRSG